MRRPLLALASCRAGQARDPAQQEALDLEQDRLVGRDDGQIVEHVGIGEPGDARADRRGLVAPAGPADANACDREWDRHPTVAQAIPVGGDLEGRIEKDDWVGQAQRLVAEAAAGEVPAAEGEGAEAKG